MPRIGCQPPERDYITSRYLKRLRPLVNKAFERLVRADELADGLADEGEIPAEMTERKRNLNAQRLDRVIEELKKSDASSVIDIGCGEGNLLRLLISGKAIYADCGHGRFPPCAQARSGEARACGNVSRCFKVWLPIRFALQGIRCRMYNRSNRASGFAAPFGLRAGRV